METLKKASSSERSAQIGDIIGFDKQNEPIRIKRIHERCSQTPGPHLHIVTGGGNDSCRLL